MLQALKSWTWWLLRWLLAAVVVGWLLSLLPLARDSTDGDWPHRSGLRVVTDAATGCEYLIAAGGGITPRVNGADKQLGCHQ